MFQFIVYCGETCQVFSYLPFQQDFIELLFGGLPLVFGFFAQAAIEVVN